jgi:hypothetical protein
MFHRDDRYLVTGLGAPTSLSLGLALRAGFVSWRVTVGNEQ